MSVTIPGGLAELAARLAPGSAAPAEITHASLYEITVTVVIAVLVVLYFDEKVRGAMTPQQRGYAIGWLGGILTAGIFMPVMALAGFVADTRGVRLGTVITVALFLLGAFGVAISAWGREDARRLRAAQAPAPMPQAPPLPDPSPHLSERERCRGARLRLHRSGHVRDHVHRADPGRAGRARRAGPGGEVHAVLG